MLGDKVGDDFGMLGGDVGGLTVVDREIKELPVWLRDGRGRLRCRLLGGLTFALRSVPCVAGRHEMPARGAHARLGELTDLRVDALDHITPAADMREERAIRPGDILA